MTGTVIDRVKYIQNTCTNTHIPHRKTTHSVSKIIIFNKTGNNQNTLRRVLAAQLSTKLVFNFESKDVYAKKNTCLPVLEIHVVL